MSERPVALVTGASRGIGRAIAIALASSGHDLVITGRTLHEGSAVNPATGNSLPGSLNATAEAVERAGGRAYRVRADILDLDDVEASFERSLAATGGIDVLVNNAVYVGPGNDVPLSEGSPDDIISRVAGNLTAPLLLTRAFLHRIADMVVVEHPTIRAFNVNPGFVATERVLDSGTGLEWVARHGVSPSVIGRAVATMIADPTITNGGYVHAQPYLRERLGDDEYEALLKSAKAGDDDH